MHFVEIHEYNGKFRQHLVEKKDHLVILIILTNNAFY